MQLGHQYYQFSCLQDFRPPPPPPPKKKQPHNIHATTKKKKTKKKKKKRILQTKKKPYRLFWRKTQLQYPCKWQLNVKRGTHFASTETWECPHYWPHAWRPVKDRRSSSLPSRGSSSPASEWSAAAWSTSPLAPLSPTGWSHIAWNQLSLSYNEWMKTYTQNLAYSQFTNEHSHTKKQNNNKETGWEHKTHECYFHKVTCTRNIPGCWFIQNASCTHHCNTHTMPTVGQVPRPTFLHCMYSSLSLLMYWIFCFWFWWPSSLAYLSIIFAISASAIWLRPAQTMAHLSTCQQCRRIQNWTTQHTFPR